jgi:hypothetical protein
MPKLKKLLRKLLILNLLPMLLVVGCIGAAGVTNSSNSKDEYSVIDVVIFYQPSSNADSVLKQFESITWLNDCREEIKSLRSASVFKTNSSDNEETKTKKLDAKERASAFYYGWYCNSKKGGKSPIPAGQNKDWDALGKCFLDTALTSITDDTEFSLSYSDACWKKLEELYGISITKKDVKNFSNIYESIHKSRFYSTAGSGIIGELFNETTYPENTYLIGGTSECENFWNSITNDSANKTNFILSPYYRQCVDVSHWRFWTLYETDFSIYEDGNGEMLVKDIVQNFGDSSHTTPNGYYFSNSTEPSGGAIFSRAVNAGHGRHTGMIEKVEGDYLWFTDGNVTLSGKAKGARVNVKVAISDFLNSSTYCAGGCTFAVPQKTAE